MKELEIEMRVRNNRLKERRLSLGLSQEDLCKKAGIPHSTYVRLENMNPNQKIIDTRYGKIKWVKSVLILADFYDVEPIELFPANVINLAVTRMFRKIDSDDIPSLIPGKPTHLLSDTLNPEEILLQKEKLETIDDIVKHKFTPRMKDVWQKRCLENQTYEEICSELGVTRERIRQIEQRIFRVVRSYVEKYDMKEQLIMHKRELQAWEEHQRHDQWTRFLRAIEVMKAEQEGGK